VDFCGQDYCRKTIAAKKAQKTQNYMTALFRNWRTNHQLEKNPVDATVHIVYTQ